MPGLCGWFHCLDHAVQRYLVVISAALQLVVVTALYRPRKPPRALKPAAVSGSVCTYGCSAVQSGVVPAEENLTAPAGASAAPVLDASLFRQGMGTVDADRGRMF
jgi:hypothetical protein